MKNRKHILALSLFGVLFLTACSGRDLSNVRTSLYGRWSDQANTHHYFRDDGITRVSEDGDQVEYEYRVLEHDEVKNMIILELTSVETGGSHISEFIYTNDDRDRMKAIVPLDSFRLAEADEEDEVALLVDDIMKDLIASREGQTIEDQLEYIDDSEEP